MGDTKGATLRALAQNNRIRLVKFISFQSFTVFFSFSALFLFILVFATHSQIQLKMANEPARHELKAKDESETCLGCLLNLNYVLGRKGRGRGQHKKDQTLMSL